MDISNRTLAFFLIAAIVVSVAGTLISLNKINQFQKGGATGFAVTQAGNVSLYINKTAAIRFNPTCAIDWGSGSVNTTNASMNNCTMNTTGNGYVEPIYCIQWTAKSGCVIENYGNLRVNLSLNFSSNGTSLIQGGGSPPAIWWFNITENETGSCSAGMHQPAQYYAGWSNITQVFWTNGSSICDNLSSTTSGNNSLRIDFALRIPYDAPSGTKTLNMTAIGEAVET